MSLPRGSWQRVGTRCWPGTTRSCGFLRRGCRSGPRWARKRDWTPADSSWLPPRSRPISPLPRRHWCWPRDSAYLWNPDLPRDSRAVLEALPEVPEGLEPWNRPDLLAKIDELEKVQIEDRLSRRFWSFPEVYVGWKTLRDADLDLAGPVYGVDWQLPLFDRRQADRQRVTEELAAAQAELDWSKQKATADLEVALVAYKTLRQTIREARSVAAKSDEVLQMGGAAFAEGEYTTTDLLEIWSAVVTTQLAVLDLEFEALAAHREIEVAVGQTLPLGGTS